MYRKTYYVDRHKAPDVVADRKNYLKKNTIDELEEKCWLHLSLPEYKDTFKKVKAKETSEVEKFIWSKTHFYVNEKGLPYAEIHMFLVAHECLPSHVKPVLSVRKRRKKELVVFGQDECIFRSSHLNDNTWYIDDKAVMRSKGMGQGIMVSGFSLVKFGFGVEMNNGGLEKINNFRTGKKYQEEDAATYLYGSPTKQPLK